MKTLFTLLTALTLPWLAYTQNYSFSRMANCPQPIYSPAYFTIGDSVYVVGGVISHLGTYPTVLTTNVWMYNVPANIWTQKNNFPGTPVYGASGFAIGNNGYIVNGWDSTGSGQGPSTLWQYDAGTDTWTTKASFPGSTRYTAGVFTLNNKGYIVAGFKPYVSDMYSYDPSTDSWSSKAALPGPSRQALVYFTIGNYAYAGMGATGDNMGGYYINSDFYKYDPIADAWVTLSNFPGDPLSSSYTFTINNEAYVVNGLNESDLTYVHGASNKVWKYTPNTDTWSLWGLFPDTAIYEGASGTVGNDGYMGFGAKDWFSWPLTTKFWRFGPGTGPYSCNATIAAVALNNTTENFQALGNFSPNAQISWNFGDNHLGSGTSVFHQYTAAGNYHVTLTVTDSADTCTFAISDTVTISNVTTCSVSVGSTNIGSSYTLYTNTSGAGPFTYVWSEPSDTSFNSTSPDPLVTLTPGVNYYYCVTVTDTTGCTATGCTNLFDSAISYSCQTYLYIYPDSNLPGVYYAQCYHTGGSCVNYDWSFGDGTYSGSPNPSHTYSSPGYYSICVTITDIDSCVSSYCDSFFYAYKMGGGPMLQLNAVGTLATGLQNLTGPVKVSVFPNPATDELTVQAVTGALISNVVVYTIQGQQVMKNETLPNNQLDISKLASGVYFMELKVGEANVKTKFVKEN